MRLLVLRYISNWSPLEGRTCGDVVTLCVYRTTQPVDPAWHSFGCGWMPATAWAREEAGSLAHGAY